MGEKEFKKTGIGEEAPDIINVVVEIPKGSHNKYEYDEERSIFKLDRVLHSPLHYPADYGFIPETRALDGDPLDAMVIGTDPTFPGCLVRCRPIGLLKMKDEGEKDFKVLGVQVDNRGLDNVKDIDDLKTHNPHFLKETAHFFKSYKALENKEVEVLEWGERKDAVEEIEKTRKRYEEE